MQLPSCPAIPPRGTHPKNPKRPILKKTHTCVYKAAASATVEIRKQPTMNRYTGTDGLRKADSKECLQ